MTGRVAVFRALYLGDLLLAVPAWRALRRHLPDAEITLIGLPWAGSLAARYSHLIDRFVPFPGFPGIEEVTFEPDRTARFLEEQRSYGYDLAIQMHGTGATSNAFVFSLGARRTAGYYPPGSENPGLDVAVPYPDGIPEIWRNLGLAALLGAKDTDTTLELPLEPGDLTEATQLLAPVAGRGPLIGLHPGSKRPSRRWPAEYYAGLAGRLVRRYGATIVLTGGADELETCQKVAAALPHPRLILAGRTSLGGLAAVMARLDLFISNDTGPAHLADAVHTPAITIFGPGDYQRWAPLDQERHPSLRRPVKCSPCLFWECPIDHRCLRRIAPAEVLDLAERLLEERTAA